MTPGEASKAGSVLEIGQGTGALAAHVFDLEDGLAFIELGWADAYPGSGQPCHKLTGKFEQHTIQGGGWISLEGEDSDINITIHAGSWKPDGPRDKAREILERCLRIKIPPGTIGSQE